MKDRQHRRVRFQSPTAHILTRNAPLWGLILSCCLAGAVGLFAESPGPAAPVSFRHGELTVPTYTYSRSDMVAPLFGVLEKGGIYPYARLDQDSRSPKPVPVKYECLTLENEYLRVEFLPELGGRIWRAFDKKARRDIFYYTTVIKPGRYNQRGGWPVGNLELYGPFDAHMLTWPGEPWSWSLLRQPDGGASITLSHIDHFFRNKVSLVVTLRPGHAFLETTVQLRNRTLLPNRYLLWTNAGVAVTEGSRFVYPMTKTIGHDSSALGTWPIINGVDVSWNRNNRYMLGVFGLDIYDDFMSIYDDKTDYGTICFTDRRLARGMKTWTFGSGPTAYRQAEQYTDSDGIYMETQSGRFIWDGNYEMINPGKTDRWTEYWFGAGGLGGLTTATRDLALRLEAPAERPAEASLALTATALFPGARLELTAGDQKIWTSRQDLAVGSVFRQKIALPASTAGLLLRLQVWDSRGESLLDYTQYAPGTSPRAVYAGDSVPRNFGPLETLTSEEAFQKGLGHEKFGQLEEASLAYEAALTKDALFSPAHIRLGLLALGRFENTRAREHLAKALERDPTNGDAHYLLATLMADEGKFEEARRHYSRLLPHTSQFERRDYYLALLDLKENQLKGARARLEAVAALVPQDLSVRQAHAYILRKSGALEAAAREQKALLQLDPTSAFAMAESRFAAGKSAGTAASATNSPSTNPGTETLLHRFCAGHAQGYLELASDYLRLSAWEEAGKVLEWGMAHLETRKEKIDPMLHYSLAYVAGRMNQPDLARQQAEKAKGMDLQVEIFPFRNEDLTILTSILQRDNADANAATLLGDLYYSRGRREEGQKCWRLALQSSPLNFSALRNLGMALLAEEKREEGVKFLAQAATVRPDHRATTLLVATTSARLGDSKTAREVFQRALAQQPGKDILVETLASVEAQMGNLEQALDMLLKHKFGATHQTYSLLHLYRGIRLSLAQKEASAGNFDAALNHVRAAAAPPTSLGIDDFATIQSSRLLVSEALLHTARRDSAAAAAAWKAAAGTRDDDVEMEGLFRAIALAKSGEKEAARSWLKDFPSINKLRMTDSNLEMRLHALGLEGIYRAYLGDEPGARRMLGRALEVDPLYLYARQTQNWLDAGLLRFLTPEGTN